MKSVKNLRQFAKATYIALLNNDSPEVVKVIVELLFPIWQLIDEEVADGLGFELWLWAGLKADGSEMGRDYGDGIMQGYGKYLK